MGQRVCIQQEHLVNDQHLPVHLISERCERAHPRSTVATEVVTQRRCEIFPTQHTIPHMDCKAASAESHTVHTYATERSFLLSSLRGPWRMLAPGFNSSEKSKGFGNTLSFPLGVIGENPRWFQVCRSPRN